MVLNGAPVGNSIDSTHAKAHINRLFIWGIVFITFWISIYTVLMYFDDLWTNRYAALVLSAPTISFAYLCFFLAAYRMNTGNIGKYTTSLWYANFIVVPIFILVFSWMDQSTTRNAYIMYASQLGSVINIGVVVWVKLKLMALLIDFSLYNTTNPSDGRVIAELPS